jgi:hypothetical protein
MHAPSSEYHHGDALPAVSLTDSSILLLLDAGAAAARRPAGVAGEPGRHARDAAPEHVGRRGPLVGCGASHAAAQQRRPRAGGGAAEWAHGGGVQQRRAAQVRWVEAADGVGAVQHYPRSRDCPNLEDPS